MILKASKKGQELPDDAIMELVIGLREAYSNQLNPDYLIRDWDGNRIY